MTDHPQSQSFKRPVSARAVLARLNRKLADRDMLIRKCRESSRSYYDLGEYYAINTKGGYIVAKKIDLSGLAMEEGLLKNYEAVTDP